MLMFPAYNLLAFGMSVCENPVSSIVLFTHGYDDFPGEVLFPLSEKTRGVLQ